MMEVPTIKVLPSTHWPLVTATMPTATSVGPLKFKSDRSRTLLRSLSIIDGVSGLTK